MTREIAGKVAIVTGAGRNIGRAIALALVNGGASVVVNARSNRAEAESVAEQIGHLEDIPDVRALTSRLEGNLD